MLTIGIILIIIAAIALVVLGGVSSKHDSTLRCVCVLILLFAFIVFCIGMGYIVDHYKRDAINYYVNHQDEFVIDTISVNGVVEHYEVRLK